MQVLEVQKVTEILALSAGVNLAQGLSARRS